MKIAIIGDMHLGAFSADERCEDSFAQANEAMELAVRENAGLILLTGDIFDSRIPTQDILAKAMKIFHKAKSAGNNTPGLKIDKLINKDEKEIPKSAFYGIPVIAIHGNHDRRGKGLTNPVELLEKAGLLVHLNVASIVLSINNEKAAIHGMSYVPEKYAKEVLEKFNPQPFDDAKNIFMLHQSIGQYVFSDEEHPTLMLEDLPAGFDLIVDGHIHWNDEHKKGGMNFLLAGSTISTQMRKIEAERPKAVYIFDTATGKIRAIELETQRELFYETLDFGQIEPDELRKKLSEKLSAIKPKKHAIKPLVRIVLKGTIKKGFETADLNLHKLEEEFRGKFILHISREKLLSKEACAAGDGLEQLLKNQASIEERGLQILQKNLQGTDFGGFAKTEELLNILAEESSDSAYRFLRENFKGVK